MNYSLKNLKFLLGTLWSRNGSNSDENYLSNLWIISCITFIEITTRHVEWCSSSNPPPSPNQHCSSLLWNSTAHKYTMQSQLGPQQWSGCSVSSCNPNLFFLEKGIYWSGNPKSKSQSAVIIGIPTKIRKSESCAPPIHVSCSVGIKQK